jgi:predicted nucleotidyltransferase
MTGAADILRAITKLLDDAEIPYMVVGSFASMAHGEPRTTHDLDIVIVRRLVRSRRSSAASTWTRSTSIPMWHETLYTGARCSTSST